MRSLSFRPLLEEVEERLELIAVARREIWEAVPEVAQDERLHFRVHLDALTWSRKGTRKRKAELQELLARWDDQEQKRHGLMLIQSQLIPAAKLLERAIRNEMAGSELWSLLEKQIARFEDWLGGFGQKPTNLRKDSKQD